MLAEGCCWCRSPGVVARARHWPGSKAHHPVLPRRGPDRAVARSRCPVCVSELHAFSCVFVVAVALPACLSRHTFRPSAIESQSLGCLGADCQPAQHIPVSSTCLTLTIACAVPRSDLRFDCISDKLVDPDKIDDKRTIEASCIFPRSASDILSGGALKALQRPANQMCKSNQLLAEGHSFSSRPSCLVSLTPDALHLSVRAAY